VRFVAAVGLVMLAACSTLPTGPAYLVQGVALAGPTCPVETDPPQPGCEPRPVSRAELLVRSEDGELILTARTGVDGTFEFEVPAGRYLLEPQPVEGLMGTAAQVEFEVTDTPVELPVLDYDTGIR